MRQTAKKLYLYFSSNGTTYSMSQLNLLKYKTWYFLSYLVCLFPVPLKALLKFSFSDKETVGGHHYGGAYSKYFSSYKYRFITLLEIGIGGGDSYSGGESLNAWQMYFPFARIIGADIEDRAALANLRTRTYRLDQGDAAALTDLATRERGFDIIIDDGSHLSKHIVGTFKTLFPHLRDGGLYVIEDIQTSYWKFDWWDGSSLTAPAFEDTAVGFFSKLVRYLNYMEMHGSDRREIEAVPEHVEAMRLAQTIRSIHFEHNLIILRKAPNRDVSNRDAMLKTV